MGGTSSRISKAETKQFHILNLSLFLQI